METRVVSSDQIAQSYSSHKTSVKIKLIVIEKILNFLNHIEYNNYEKHKNLFSSATQGSAQRKAIKTIT